MTDSPRDRIPGYLAALSVFGGGWAAFARHVVRSGTPLPARYAVTDLLLGGVATHKFARLISKEGVTTPLRAPFTEFQGVAGSAEVNEKVREGHPLHTVGELLTCPFCLAPWISSAYVAGLVVAPGIARTWAAVFTVVGGADMLQHVYAQVRAD
ncbi:MAG TPA: DUF1360 domain-containing protein [Nocardioidaceae bacterium]|nr:DUF1360 domain-containing protein [Nocardioidaceae bacterium]